ncbi:MAG: FAD/NAD(P)-binding protein [Acidobacteriota bacterium]
MDNPYRPDLMRIVGVRDETPDVRTLELDFLDREAAREFSTAWGPGQFGHFTVWGAGECVFTIANAPPLRPAGGDVRIECTFRAIGKVTNALRGLASGEIIGFRGPYGNTFPVADWKGRDLMFIGGGIGMAALRSPIQYVLDRRAEFGQIVILNGARTASDLVYREEMWEWQKKDGVRVVRTVDPGGETPEWDGEVGLLPHVFERLALGPDGRAVVVCGPPVMLHFMFLSLEKLGYSPQQVVTTLENKMKCGIGLCGRCNIGPFFVCRDGPVVTWAQMQTMPKDM